MKRRITSGEKALTFKQVEKLLGVLTNIEEDTLLRLALSTGIRREDIVSIEDRNIDLKEGTIKYREGKKNRIWTALWLPVGCGLSWEHYLTVL